MRTQKLRNWLPIWVLLAFISSLVPVGSVNAAATLAAGNKVMVSYLPEVSLTLFNKPGGVKLTDLPAGTVGTLTKGPSVVGNETWWRIRGTYGGEGWVRASANSGGKQTPTLILATPSLFQTSIDLLTKSAQTKPNDGAVFENRGLMYINQYKFEQAIVDLKKAVSLQPKDAWAYFYLGLAYHSVHAYTDALNDYTQAIKLNPTEVVFYDNRGTTYVALESYEPAVDDFNRAQQVKPEYTVSMVRQGTALGIEGAQAGYPTLLSATEQDPDSALAWRNLANFLASPAANQLDMALADYDKAIKADPTNANNYVARAFTWIDAQVPAKAQADLEKAIQLEPDNENAHYAFGNYYFGMQDYQKAVSEYSRAIDLYPYFLEAFMNRGNTYLLLGQSDAAIKDYNRAIQIEPGKKCGCAYEGLGTVYYALGDWQKALDNYQRYLALVDSPDQTVVNRVAELKQKLGK